MLNYYTLLSRTYIADICYLFCMYSCRQQWTRSRMCNKKIRNFTIGRLCCH